VNQGGIVTVSLAHPDPDVAKDTLTRLIEAYRRKHIQVHRATEALDDLQREADNTRQQLGSIEADLRRQKSGVNIISLQEAKDDIRTQLSTLRSGIFAAEAELAERRAQLQLVEQRFGKPNATGETNQGPAVAQAPEYPAEKVDAYRMLATKLALLQKRESDLLLGTFSETSRYVLQVRDQIAETQKAISELGIDPAKLNQLQMQVSAKLGNENNGELDAALLQGKVLTLQARLTELNRQREEVFQRYKTIEGSENTIVDLERRKRSLEDKLRQYESNLEKARLDQAIDSSKNTNITLVQAPTPAGRNMIKLYQLMAGALFGMLAAGIGLGFVIEMFLDGSLKRPKDVEGKARIPLFVTIPEFGANGRPRLKLSRKERRDPSLIDSTGLVRKGEIAPWEPSDPMFEYYESLRDRVVMSYEGDPRKPKLVAVTSCNRGAGTTRISTGLAAALSRDVERDVLYIGLEKNKVSVTAFCKGRPQAEVAAEAEGYHTNGETHVTPELYSLARTGHNPGGTSIVQSFSDMIPKLRMSNYDYVIFDLPPISETSGSLRLAGQMERTLLVIESEQTKGAKVNRVRDLLEGTSTNLFAVLNKTKSYGPAFVDEGT
jgi:Mrp family chromosome partitioning ATPase